MTKKVKARLCELAPAARGSQEARFTQLLVFAFYLMFVQSHCTLLKWWESNNLITQPPGPSPEFLIQLYSIPEFPISLLPAALAQVMNRQISLLKSS